MQIKAIEDEIDLGQIEEVIEMAKDEMDVVKFYIGTLLECIYLMNAVF